MAGAVALKSRLREVGKRTSRICLAGSALPASAFADRTSPDALTNDPCALELGTRGLVRR